MGKFRTYMFVIMTRYIPYQYYARPINKSKIRRYLCRGWTCGTDKYWLHHEEEFRKIIDDYEKEKVDTINESIIKLVNRGYNPGLCAAGFFTMFGLGGFSKNYSQSYEYLKKGTETDEWACFDALTFHPYTKSDINQAKIAAERGGVLSAIVYARQIERNQPQIAYNYLQYILTISVNGFRKRQVAGDMYAQAIQNILYNGSSLKNSWQYIKEQSKLNLLHALWASSGYYSGEIGEKNISNAIKILLPFIRTTPYAIDIEEVIKMDNNVDKKGILHIADMLGQDIPKILLSFARL